MATPLARVASDSVSTDYFEEDDSELIEALNNTVLPGDVVPEIDPAEESNVSEDIEMPPCTQPGLKRRRSPDSENEDAPQTHHGVLSSVDENKVNSAYLNNDTYGASRFGGFGEYMARKRAKLQIQNAEMDDEEEGSVEKSKIFNEIQIYINGWTEPSVQDLRQLIIHHGGIYHAYLDRKALVTHIITCSLTPAKIREFQHMKVVKPEWLVESVKAGTLLPWHDFIFKPGERVEQSQGRKVAQRSLFHNFVSQSTKKAGPSAPSKLSRANIPPIPPTQPQDITDIPLSPVQNPPVTPPHTSNPLPVTSSPIHPLYITDPATPSQASRVPDYASHKSNPAAQKAMQDPAWRAAHTSVAPDFIEGYYKNSRLHHLSTWKAELKELVAEASERVENGNSIGAGVGEKENGEEEAVTKIVRENMGGKGWIGSGSSGGGDDSVSMREAHLVMRSPSSKAKGKEEEKTGDADQAKERVIMHCDFDSFFVSAGLVDRPHLRGKPVVVCHSQGTQGGKGSTSEIASASYEARKFGIKGGMSLQQARKLCPTVLTMPYEFQRYKQFSLQFYTILMAHADDLQAVSVDEALIDVTNSVRRIKSEIARSQNPAASPADPVKEFAEAIRTQVRKATGCEVSIGIAHNIMLARLASRRAKPAGSYHISLADVSAFLVPLDIDDLHGFGYSARQKAEEKLGATNLGELVKKSKAVLCEALGKGTGEVLYNAIRGIDEKKLESDKPRKSVSCDINYGIRFETNEQAETFMYQLAQEVSRRLNSIDMRGRSLTLKVMKRDASAPIEAPKICLKKDFASNCNLISSFQFMGHGLCETFTKQIQVNAPGGRATSDDKIISEHACKLLKSLNFDPKELRGIGIQIQKLEKASGAPEVEQGQAVLPFKPVEPPKKPESDPVKPPQVRIQPPSQDDDIVEITVPAKPSVPGPSSAFDLPSFSQVDKSIFDALPDDVRQELEAEYKRRSVTPNPEVIQQPRSRSTSLKPEPRKINITVKGTNVKRITQQLAPKSRSSISPTKNKLFAKRVTFGSSVSSVKISEAELRRLKIDPEVFAALPSDLQREQLTGAKARAAGGSGLAFGGPRKVLKPISRIIRRVHSPGYVPFRPPPPPKAKYIESPTLKQQGKTKGEKLVFSETDDVQNVIEAWVNGFLEHPPNQKDVEYFAKFLVQCVDKGRSTDSGVEKALKVTKWWLVLLRRNFGVWENAEEEVEVDVECGSSEATGRAWWKAFREVKGKMDLAARKKFGGCLSLR